MTAREQSLSEIRDAVAKLCASFPMEYWRELDRERRYPTGFVRALTESGYLSCLIPEEYGGAGLGLSAAAAILEEIQRSGANGAACHAQMYTMGTVLRHCSEAQKRKYLPKIARGELRLQAFGITEPSAGSDTSSIRTTAVRKGERYVVNGQKVWTSRAEHSDLMLLFARTTPREQVQKKTDGMSVFLVDMKAALGKGLTIRPIRTMINHATTEVFFDNLEVPAENLVGEEGKGFRCILDGMNGVQFPIARAYMATEAAALMVERATLLYESGKPCGPESNMAKQLAAEASWQAADMCLQTHGGFGFAEEYDVERKFRETRLYQIAPISTNLVLCYLAEHVLQLPRSY